MLEQLKRKKGKPNVQRFKGLGRDEPCVRKTTLDRTPAVWCSLTISDEDEEQQITP